MVTSIVAAGPVRAPLSADNFAGFIVVGRTSVTVALRLYSPAKPCRQVDCAAALASIPAAAAIGGRRRQKNLRLRSPDSGIRLTTSSTANKRRSALTYDGRTGGRSLKLELDSVYEPV